jgi:hypothetical protein
VKSHLERFLTESALRRGLDLTDELPKHQEIIRMLWNHLNSIGDLEPGDIYGDEELCAEIVAKSNDILARVEMLCGASVEETPNAN